MPRTDKPLTAPEVPAKVAVSSTGTISNVPPPAATETIRGTQEVLDEQLAALKASFTDPTKEDQLVTAYEHLGQMTEIRIGSDPAKESVARPSNAATHLVPAAEAMIDTLRTSPILGPLVPRLRADELAGRVQKLRFLRKLHKAIAPTVRALEIAIASLEQGIDVDLRDVYRQIRSLLPFQPRLAESLLPVTDLISAPAQRGALTRKKNDRRQPGDPAEPAVTPPPAAGASPTPGTPGSAQPVPVPVPPLRLPQGAAAPRRRARATRR